MNTRDLLKTNIMNILENNKGDMEEENLNKALGNIFSNKFKEKILKELQEENKIYYYEKIIGRRNLNYYAIPFYNEYDNIKKLLKKTNNNLNIENHSMKEIIRDFLFNELLEINNLVKKLDTINYGFKEISIDIIKIHLNSIKIILSSCIKKNYTNYNDVLREITDKESPLNKFILKDNMNYNIIKKLNQDDFLIKYINYFNSLSNKEKTIIKNKGIVKIKSVLRKLDRIDNINKV